MAYNPNKAICYEGKCKKRGGVSVLQRHRQGHAAFHAHGETTRGRAPKAVLVGRIPQAEAGEVRRLFQGAPEPEPQKPRKGFLARLFRRG